MRLTKVMKSVIVDKVVAAIVNDPVAQARIRLEEIAQEAVNKRYSKKVWQWLQSAPKGGVQKRHAAALLFPKSEEGGCRKNVYHKLLTKGHSSELTFSLKSNIEVLFADSHVWLNPVTIPGNRVNEVKAILKTLDKLSETAQAAEEKVKLALAAVSTSKQLEERYPSLAKYLPEQEKGEEKGKALALTDNQLQKYLP